MKVTSAVIGLLQRKRQNRNGQYPIYVYVNWHGRVEHATGIACSLSDWDKKRQRIKATVPNASILNSKLIAMVNDLEKKKMRYELEGISYTAKSLMDRLGKEDRCNTSFEAVARDYMASKMLSYNTQQGYEQTIKLWKDYIGSGSIVEVDSARLKKLVQKLKSDGYAATTVQNIMMRVSAVYRHAIEENELDVPNPVSKLKMKKEVIKREKIALTEKQIGMVREYLEKNLLQPGTRFLALGSDNLLEKVSSPVTSMAIFYVMMAMSGLAPVDMTVLNNSDIKLNNGVTCIEKSRRKTGKPFFIAFPDDGLFTTIIDHYRVYSRQRDGYIFPAIARKGKVKLTDELIARRAQIFCQTVNRGIKRAVAEINRTTLANRIPKGLTLYCARHSFATFFLSKSGNIQALCTALGRSANSIQQYIHQLKCSTDMKFEISKLF